MSEIEFKQQERYDLEELHSVLLVGVYPSGKDITECLASLQELGALADTYGFDVARQMACPIKKITSATYIGEGKALEIRQILLEEKIDGVIFDEEISPNQQKNLEEIIRRPVLDRTELIIEVFHERAQTKEASLQVELAKVRYQFPRLARMWTHLSRQKTGGGGGGYLRGTGEKQIEVDRRLLKARIQFLEKEIKTIRSQREIQRRQRMRLQVPTFAIVGYTNAGKSTLLNALTAANVLAEDKLFATLDTTSRKYNLPNHQEIILVDTVGFIRKLPHSLVAAFKSTLEEVCYTDILLHLVDVSNPRALEQMEATFQVLKELGADTKPMIILLNKIDRCDSDVLMFQIRLKYPKTVCISAKERTGFDILLDMMMKEIEALRKVVKLKIPQSEFALASKLMREGRVISSEYEENDILMEVEIPKYLEGTVKSFLDERFT